MNIPLSIPGRPSGLTEAGWQALSNPRSIALVGASGRASSVSFTTRFLQTNVDLGYAGDIYLINPHRDAILDRKCWPMLDALPERADIVAINLPDEKVLPAVREAIAHGARALMIHSGGFGERGEAGAQRERELKQLCAQAGVAALGPNCLGIMSLANKVSVSSFRAPKSVRAGSIAAISQSGSVAGILMQIAGRHGLSFLASTGNEAVTTTEDLIRYAIDDPSTRLIVAFLEALRRPRELFSLAEKAHRAGKPIIVLKAGMTEQGGQVSRGHTGALAGSGAVYRQAFAQAGIVLVDDFDELAQTVELFATIRRIPKRLRVGMLGTSGGELGRITDQCIELGVDLPTLQPSTLSSLQTALYLPDDVLPRNPVDAGTGFNFPGTYRERMRGAIRAVAADDGVDVIAVMQGFNRDSEDLAFSLNREMMGAAADESASTPKPVLVLSSRAGNADEEVLADVRQANVPALEGAREALRAIHHMTRYARHLAERGNVPEEAGASPTLSPPSSWENGSVPQFRLFPWLGALGLPVLPVRTVTTAAQAAAAASDLGPVVVMKIDTSRIVHKSDVGGVALGVTQGDAASRFQDLVRCLTPPVGAGDDESVVVAPQLMNGIEFYIGAKQDESFGPVVVCGLGGRLLEILAKTALLVAPFTKKDALAAIEQSGAVPFLSGFRGGAVADLDALAGTLVKVGTIAQALGPRLEVLDLNPVIITQDHPGGVIADARLMLNTEEEL